MTSAYAGPVLFDDPAEGQTATVIAPVPVPEALPAGSEGHAAAGAEDGAGQPRAAVLGPALLDMPEGLSAGREEQDWAPGLLQAQEVPRGSLGWVAGSLAVILLGWLVLSAVGFVGD
ncbi:hypothetical protein [Muricoccus aerilatus]|uniref:hypothetical protein n=1 Tax=Muricoccus aerilatus TaxID=452982 RepID=UPI0005C257B2|nr:hypothetical protein [Roseomonas aerilata]